MFQKFYILHENFRLSVLIILNTKNNCKPITTFVTENLHKTTTFVNILYSTLIDILLYPN